jgi:hypothetical protein
VPASIKRFLDLSENADTTYQSVLFENFGVAVYWAQLFEGTLQNLLMGMEVTSLYQSIGQDTGCRQASRE